MNLKTPITALVAAGTSAAALADPVVRDHHGVFTTNARNTVTSSRPASFQLLGA